MKAKQKYIWYIYRGSAYDCREGIKKRGGIFRADKKMWYFLERTEEIKSFCKIMRLKLKKIKIEAVEDMKCKTCINSTEKGDNSLPDGVIGALHIECFIRRERVDPESGCYRWKEKINYKRG